MADNSLKRVQKLYEKRRKAKLCINGGEKCGPVYKGGRCRLHWDRNQKTVAAAVAARRRARPPKIDPALAPAKARIAQLAMLRRGGRS